LNHTASAKTLSVTESSPNQLFFNKASAALGKEFSVQYPFCLLTEHGNRMRFVAVGETDRRRRWSYNACSAASKC